MSYDVDILASRKHGMVTIGVTNDIARRDPAREDDGGVAPRLEDPLDRARQSRLGRSLRRI
jgi:hypothetical protein